MDVDKEEDSVKDLSFELEDMDIEACESDEETRSKMMDEKIKAKQKKTEEEENLQKLKAMTAQKNKIRKEEVKIESIQKLNKQRKQKLKDDKKKRKKVTNKNNSDKVMEVVPNIKPVPHNCVHLVNAGDVVYTVPGDGSCRPNSASAFFYLKMRSSDQNYEEE